MLSIDDAYLEALSLRKQGRLAEADSIFLSISSSKADAILMLEIAKIWFEEGRYQKSLQLFNDIKKHFSLPSSTIGKINAYIDRIEAFYGSLSYDLAFFSTKNPNRNASTGMYYVLGMPLFYSNSQEKRYFGTSHKITYDKVYNEELKASVIGTLRDFESHESDAQTFQFSLIRKLVPSKYFIEGQISVEDGSGYIVSKYGPKFGLEANLNGTPTLTYFGLSKLNNSSSNVLEGKQIQFGQSIFNPMKIKSSKFEYLLQKDMLKHDIYSNQNSSLSFRKDFSFDRFTAGVSVFVSETIFLTEDFFWRKTRKDRKRISSISICPNFHKFFIEKAVCVNLSVEKRDSNISFYDYDEDTLEISFKNIF